MSSLFGIGANGASSFYNGAIEQSCRFPANSGTSSANSRLTKTFSTVDSSVHWTLNFWIKRSATAGVNPVGSARPLDVFCPRSGTSASVLHEFHFGAPGSYGAGDAFVITNTNSGTYILSTTHLFLDASSWYNIHVQADLDNGTNGEKLKIFVNGVEAAYTTDNRASYTSMAGIAAGAWTIGDYYNYGYPIQSYLANWAYVDGSTLAPTVFGEFSEGVWIPKKITGVTWGSAGHLLAFQDSSALGDDTSGNGNDWLTSNIRTADQMPDTPENNYATMNHLSRGVDTITFSEGNLKSSFTSDTDDTMAGCTFALPKEGKWYWEQTFTGAATNGSQAPYCGIYDLDTLAFGYSDNFINSGGDFITYYTDNNSIKIASSSTDYVGSVAEQTGAVVGFAVDMDGGHLWVHVNGTWINGTPTFSDGTNKVASPNTDSTYIPFWTGNGGGAMTWEVNFGQSSFTGTKPSGYKILNSSNLPEPSIGPNSLTKPGEHFNALLYTGNGSDGHARTGLGFKPDLVWIKPRSDADNNVVFDSTRGVQKYMYSNTVGQEYTGTNSLTAFGTDGFTLNDWNNINENSQTYVAWCWKANGGTTSSNGEGATSSTVQANTTAGFSIVGWTGTGSATTLGHGLDLKPQLIIVKNRTDGRNWTVYNEYNGGNGQMYFTTGAYSANSGSFNNTAPTATVFTVNSDQTTNESGDAMIAYCFHSVEGYSKFGVYTGNNALDQGRYVNTGFRPKFLLVKRADSTGWWAVTDSVRSTTNTIANTLDWSNTYSESSLTSDLKVDFLSNGFKLREQDAYYNGAGGKYIYLAIAEMPFKYANAR